MHGRTGDSGRDGRLAADVGRDGVDLQLRIGLNSGQVIAGEIGSGRMSYTAIGEQVGMAQRMESVAPPGGVMLSESTARLVEDVRRARGTRTGAIKGATRRFRRRLLAVGEHEPGQRNESKLVGRTWEMDTSRSAFWRRPSAAPAASSTSSGRRVSARAGWPAKSPRSRPTRKPSVFNTYCESHTSDVPFHVVSRLFARSIGNRRCSTRESGACTASRTMPHADADDVACSRICWESVTPQGAARHRPGRAASTIDGADQRCGVGAEPSLRSM